MISSVRLWRAVIRRSRSDWPVVLAAWLLLLCATTLLATGSLYADTVAAGGVRRSLLDAPAEQRLISARTTASRPGDIASLDPAFRGSLERAIARTGGEVSRTVRTGSFADATTEPDAVTTLTLLAAYETLDRHATLVAGEWPAAGANPVRAALSESAAEALGVGAGDRLSLVSRLDAEAVVDVQVAAIYRPDRSDPYWAGDPLELAGVVPGEPYTSVGPVVVPMDDLLGPAVDSRLEVQWRAVPDIGRLQVDDVEALRTGIDQIDDQIRAALPRARQFSVDAPLPALLGEAGRAVVVSRSGVTLLTIQFAVLAGYAVVLVGGLLLERRRAETALLRSRGATSLHLLVMALVEALALAAMAVALAPWLALGLVRLLADLGPLRGAGIVARVELGPSTWLVAAAAGLAGVLALAMPTLGSTVSLAGVRAAIGRQTSATLPQRLGIDLALVAVAVVAIWQLRLYGAPLTRNARGVLGVDPLLVAAPAIGLLGGAVLALRVVPRVAELAERLLERSRGLVAPLGSRQLARRPLRYTRAALLLMLAAGLGTFATAHAATWTRSQGDQAGYQAATDIRAVPGRGADRGGLTAGDAYRSIPGVAAAMPVSRDTIDLGRNVRGGPLLALDPDVAGSIVTFQSASAAAPATGALRQLADAPDSTGPVPIAGQPRRLSIVLDAALTALPFEEPLNGQLPADHRGIAASVVLIDGDSRLHRVRSGDARGLTSGANQRLEIPLTATDGTTDGATDGAPLAEPCWPLALVSLELTVTPPRAVVLGGTIDIRAVEASEASSGEVWTAVGVDPATSGWRWSRSQPGSNEPYVPPPGAGGRIEVGGDPRRPPPIFPDQATVFRQVALPAEPSTLTVVASRRFMELTGAEAGQTLSGTTAGVRLPIRIAAAVDDFPPLDPAQPFVIVDAAAAALNRFALTGTLADPDEWWLDVEDGTSTDVANALAAPPFDSQAVVEREAVSRSLTSDPVSLGVIGALGLGAVAAMVFAAIGFIVSATVSTSERVGEFALLQALGLSGRQLAVWLSLESAFLLFVGLLAGSALGVLLAWLVLPFATLTETGAPAIPAPIVVVPWQAIAPTWLLAVVLLVVTILIVRRQLPSVQISGVLRARDE